MKRTFKQGSDKERILKDIIFEECHQVLGRG